MILKAEAEKQEQAIFQAYVDITNKQACVKFPSEQIHVQLIDGPPYASGVIHLGTLTNKILKDIFIRHERLSGHDSYCIGCFDCHGLPIERKVMKQLGLETKTEIQAFGIQKFIQTCNEFANVHVQQMIESFQQFGNSLDFHQVIQTNTPQYIEHVWKLLRTIDERRLLKLRTRICPWCPTCETTLANVELEYQEIVDRSVFVKFRCPNLNAYFIAWSTCPWTLPGNAALAVHSEFVYVVIEIPQFDEKWICLLTEVTHLMNLAKITDYHVIQRLQGSELIGMSYVPEMRDLIYRQDHSTSRNLFTILRGDEFVSAHQTGLVHLAPGHGEVDHHLVQGLDIPIRTVVDSQGRVVQDVELSSLQGLAYRETNEMIIQDLIKRNLLVAEERYSHSYPFCWRCHNPLIYRATRQWFVSLQDQRQDFVEAANRIIWKNDTIQARARVWAENIQDWCISRQRFWGIPLPIWLCSECGTYEMLTTKEQITTRTKIELNHLDYSSLASVQVACQSCGKTASRVEDILDIWFDSGSLIDYLTTKEFIDSTKSIVLIEGHDQVRGFFYTLLAVAYALGYRNESYNQVFDTGFVLSATGDKLSKSLGNSIDIQTYHEKYGADTMRYALVGQVNPWIDHPISQAIIEDAYAFLNIWSNIITFVETYQKLDKIESSEIKIERTQLTLWEKWILSEHEMAKQKMLMKLKDFDINQMMSIHRSFVVESLSRSYVQAIRKILFQSTHSFEKQQTYAILFHILREQLVFISLVCPFFANNSYQRIFGQEQLIYEQKYPTVNETFIDKEIRDIFQIKQDIGLLVKYARNRVQRGIRWPIHLINIFFSEHELSDDLIKILKDELNVRNLAQTVILFEGSNIEFVYFDDKESKHAMTVSSIPGNEVGLILAIDWSLSTEELEDGYLRETLRRIQYLRTQEKLSIQEQIPLRIRATPKLRFILQKHSQHLKTEGRLSQLILEETTTFEESMTPIKDEKLELVRQRENEK